jgi:hypothetical protein
MKAILLALLIVALALSTIYFLPVSAAAISIVTLIVICAVVIFLIFTKFHKQKTEGDK